MLYSSLITKVSKSLYRPFSLFEMIITIIMIIKTKCPLTTITTAAAVNKNTRKTENAMPATVSMFSNATVYHTALN